MKNYKITLGGLSIIEIGENGTEKEIHSAGVLSWNGNYETVVVIERHLVEMLNNIQKEGENRLASMAKSK